MLRCSLFLHLLALSGIAFAVNPATAADTSATPYRLPSAAAQYRPDAREPYQRDDRYRLVRPDDTRPYARQITRAASESGLDPELVHAVIAVESAYRSKAISPKGAIGLMQVMPDTALSYGVRDASEVTANLRAGTRYLSSLMNQYDNRLDLALAAYNAGEGAVRRYNNTVPPYPETRSYVPAVVARYQENTPRPLAFKRSPAKPVYIDYLPGTRLELQKH